MKFPRRLRQILIVATVLCPTPARAQVDQRALGQQILSDNGAQRRIALAEVEKLGVQNADRELRAVMIAALRQEANMHIQRYNAGRRGEVQEDLQDAEFIGRLSQVVAELRDPNAIPALASALWTGFPAIRALAVFGERAAPAVLAVVMSPRSMHYSVDDGLITLRIMVEEMGSRPLDARTVIQIRRAAEAHLMTGKGLQLTTLWRAIDLAIVLNDPSLRGSVESIASDWNAVLARGVEDPQLIEQTQKRAADRLAGIPPQPRLH